MTLLFFAVLVVAAGAYWSWFGRAVAHPDSQSLARVQLMQSGIPATSQQVLVAAKEDDVDALELLALAKVDFHAVDKKGKSALHLAIEKQRWGMMSILQHFGLDINKSDLDGYPPIAKVIQQKKFAIADRLIESGASVDFRLADGEPALIHYLKAADDASFLYLLQRGVSPDSRGNDGKCALVHAIESGRLDLAVSLIDAGAELIDLKINDEPLLIALLAEHQKWGVSEQEVIAFIDILVSSEVDVNQASPVSGFRPLQVAIMNGKPTFVDALLRHTSDHSDCLWMALKLDQIEIVETLLKHGANADEMGTSGDSPLVAMVRSGRAELIEIFLDHGATPEQVTKEGQSLLFTAIALKQTASTLALLSHEKHPDVHQLMTSPVSEEFRKIFNSKGLVDWYCRHDSKLTPLILAILRDELEVAEKLIKLGAKRHQGTKRKAFPIQIAAALKNVQIQQLILGVPYQDDKQKRKFIIDLSDQKVHFYKDGKLNKSYRCSTGKGGYRTPTGKYVITDKQRHKVSNIYKGAQMPFFQRLSCKAIGFHKGNIGSRFASHGCIRLSYSGAKFFFAHSKVGDRVTIRK